MRWSFPHHAAIDPDHVSAQTFFLWCFRGWVQGLRDNDADQWTAVWNECARRFGAADGRRLVSSLARCVNLLRRHALADFGYHQPCCPLRSAEEHALVDVFAATATGQARRAVGHAQALVLPHGVGDMIEAVSQIALVLGRHNLPLRPAQKGSVVTGASTAGSATIH